MHSGACKYKDHSDPYTKYPCIMTCIKNCGGGELFLRKFGFFAEYKNGDVLFLKGSKVPHSVNGLITHSTDDSEIEEAYRLSLVFFNNEN